LSCLLPHEYTKVLGGVTDCKSGNTLVLDADFFYRKLIKTLAVIDIALLGRYPYEGSGIEFTSYAPTEATPLEGIGAFALLSLGVTLNTAIRLPYPFVYMGLVIHLTVDTYTAEQVTLAFVMLSLPILNTYGLVKDFHIAPSILVQKEYKTVLLNALNTALNLVCR
jgi:hypothetical protein